MQKPESNASRLKTYLASTQYHQLAMTKLPQPHQTHKRIQFEKLDRGYAASGLFKQGGHNASHLSERVVAFSLHRGEFLSRLQRLALDRFHNESIFNLASPTQSTGETLKAYTHLFNELFFFGSLKDRIRVVLDDERTVKMMGMQGKCVRVYKEKEVFKMVDLLPWSKRKNDEGKDLDEMWKFEIRLYRRDNEMRDRSKSFLAYVSTLAHELIHAFLNLWTCVYRPCRRGWEALGVTGHGKAWQEIAYAVEKAMNDEKFLNLRIDMRREVSLAMELVKEGQKRVNVGKEDLRRWRLSEEALRKEFERFDK